MVPLQSRLRFQVLNILAIFFFTISERKLLYHRQENKHKGRTVFRTMSNIYDGAFLRRQLMAFRHLLLLLKNSIIDFWQSPKHASEKSVILLEHFSRYFLKTFITVIEHRFRVLLLYTQRLLNSDLETQEMTRFLDNDKSYRIKADFLIFFPKLNLGQ